MSRERFRGMDYNPHRIPMDEGPPRFPRREFLIRTGALVALTVGGTWLSKLGGSKEGESTVAAPDKSVDLEDIDVLEEIKKFEAQVGDDTLSLHQVKNYYLPLVAEYFRRQINVPAIGTKRTTEEILRDTFIVRRDFTSEQEAIEEFMRTLKGKSEDVLTSPPVRLLGLDYPKLAISSEMARRVVFIMANGALAWVDDGKIFLVFDRFNNTKISVRYKRFDDSEEEYPVYQFQGLDYRVQCEPPKPVVKLRSVFLHELVHWESDRDWQDLPKDVVVAYQKASNMPLDYRGESYEVPPDYQVSFKSGRNKNFMASFDYATRDGLTTESGLNEFVTDYLAARMSIYDRLPYTLGYHGKHSPGDFKNFEVVLNNARINNPDLYKLYRESQLREFLVRVAKGAKEVTFKSEEEMLEFTARLFLNDSRLKTYWKYFQPYFYGINTTEYRYYVDPEKFKPSSGIPWEDPRSAVPPTELGCIHQ